MATSPLRVGNGAGFWGDNLDAPVTLARDGALDFLTLEYLAELTLAILAHLRARNPAAGYVTDFPDLLARLVPTLRDHPGLGIVTNAGGLNAPACARACGKILDDSGLGSVAIGVVTGDDVLASLRDWSESGVDLAHLEDGRPIEAVLARLVAANAYLGASPIQAALAGGARIVCAGRVADASLTLGPAWHHFGWSADMLDMLAGATVAGHLIECGAQMTGGLWHAWTELDDPAGIGYPIAELAADGTCVVTKPRCSGGLVSVATVSEQLVYEIDDPTRYRTPDVDVDLTTVRIEQTSPNHVHVSGTRGRPPSDRLKVAAVYRDGWMASGMLALAGRGAESKARAAGGVILERVRRAGFDLADSLVEVLGAGDLTAGILRPSEPPREVVLRVTARDPRREAVERFCREFAPLVTSGPTGIAGYATGRPTPRPAFGYWPTLVPRGLVADRVEVDTRSAADWAREVRQ